MKLILPYGDGKIEAELREGKKAVVLEPRYVEKVSDLKEEVCRAMDQPIGLESIDFFKGAESVCLVVSDHTRPLPSGDVAEAILNRLEEVGVDGSSVTLLVGGGLHKVNERAVRSILGRKVLRRVGELVFHDAEDRDSLLYIGKTKRGTPIWLNRKFVEADRKIVTGAVTPHQIMGFTGGAKGAAVGVAGYETIERTHSHLKSPNARLGILEGNPAREDVDEIGERANIDLLVNVVLNHCDEPVKVFAGHWFKAYRSAVEYARCMVEVRVPQRADLVLASPGGYPRDIDVYQSQKALAAAEMVVRKGGVVVLVAECREGIGNPVFEEVMRGFETPEEIVEYFMRSPFRMGVHKAYMWARALLKSKVIVVSRIIDSDMAQVLKIELTNDFDDALDIAYEHADPETVAVLPYASTIIPNPDWG